MYCHACSGEAKAGFVNLLAGYVHCMGWGKMVECKHWRDPATCLLDSCRMLVFLDEVMNEVGKRNLHSIKLLVGFPAIALLLCPNAGFQI